MGGEFRLSQADRDELVKTFEPLTSSGWQVNRLVEEFERMMNKKLKERDAGDGGRQ